MADEGGYDMGGKLAKMTRYGKDVSLGFLGISLIAAVDQRRHRLFHTAYDRRIYAKKDMIFQEFLYRNFSELIRQWIDEPETAVPFDDPQSAPIWICWFQGEEAMPHTARELLRIVREKAEHHPVHLVSLANMDRFIRIDPRMVGLFRSGKISPAHFSDCLRVCLLKQHGGVWLDSSVLLTKKLPDSVLDRPIWNAKNLDPRFPLEPKCLDITIWESYFLAAQRNSTLYRFIYGFLQEYLTRYDIFLDYLLLNHIAKIAREQIKVVRSEFGAIPSNNVNCELLGPALEQESGSSSARINDLLNSDTYVFKLSNRANYAQNFTDLVRRLK
ncbi:MAG: capsular polysaccharide synthesis protein [Bifidobacterium minimum]|jgi:hypothetical protein|nr:capsular polysaccharide synthesis protein [Bifidobacterium minimum]